MIAAAAVFSVVKTPAQAEEIPPKLKKKVSRTLPRRSIAAWEDRRFRSPRASSAVGFVSSQEG